MDVTSLVNLFYNNPTFSDIMMIINEEKVHLHKIILSQVTKLLFISDQSKVCITSIYYICIYNLQFEKATVSKTHQD